MLGITTGGASFFLRPGLYLGLHGSLLTGVASPSRGLGGIGLCFMH